MANCAIVGINWGDEGKGRVIDLLAEQADIVVRYQGGNNAGHTVVTDQGKFVLNLLPSGILHPDVVCVLGDGMVVDLEHLSNEISQKWLSDDIFSLYTVNDQDLLYRYAEHCSKLKLPIRCLLVESPSKFPVASMSLPHKNILGYEYVDTDMQTSCMYEDFTDQTPMVRKALSTAVQGLNEYGLFSCINRIEQYLAIRTALIKEGYDMESYYHPQIVRIREVHLPRSI